MRRLIVAIILASTIFLTASFCKSPEVPESDEDARPNALADVNATVAAVKAEAARVERERNYKAQVAAVIAENRAQAIAAESERKRLAAEAKRNQALLAKAIASKSAKAPIQPSRSSAYVGKAQAYEATAYTSYCEGCSGITKTGVNLRQSIYSEGKRVIAVDPRHIPLGSIVRVTLADGSSFEAIAEDIGGIIKGAIIDVAHETKADANRFGRQSVEVRMIRKGR